MSLSPTSSRSGNGGSQTAIATKTFTSAQLLSGQEFELVAVPVGKLLMAISAVAEYVPGTTPYDNPTGLFLGWWDGAACVNPAGGVGILGLDTLDPAAVAAAGGQFNSVGTTLAPFGIGLFLDVAPAGGNGSISVTVIYYAHTLT